MCAYACMCVLGLDQSQENQIFEAFPKVLWKEKCAAPLKERLAETLTESEEEWTPDSGA